MKTLVVYYSKTGTTRKVAQTMIAAKSYDFDELQYDEKAKTISFARDPAEYDRVILLSPVWAFALADPMKQYVAQHKSSIKQYDLVVTCGGFGLRGCVKNCLSSIGKPPEKAVKFRAKQVKRGDFSNKCDRVLFEN